ncbi:MAG: AAC(3) family N-acetyltransferase [Solirubrobacteraceae bacterium]|nr:AAC(3) family N-acetyltransferase [Solirubrobacteraceae bacterium]
MITAPDIAAAAARLGIEADDTLFVHAGMQHALRLEGRTRAEKLDTMVRGLRDCVARGVLILPAFSYSFCEGEPFDVRATPSRVGLLTEHFRRQEGVRRTADPIFSCAVLGDLPAAVARELYAVADKDCFGPLSVFAHLVDVRAKLLFVGVGFEACTLVHHAEQSAGVPYRYLKDFRGEVRDGPIAREVTARYFVRRLDEDVETDLEPLGDALLQDGHARAETLPRGPRLCAVDAAAVVTRARERLADEPDFLLRRGHRGRAPEPAR